MLKPKKPNATDFKDVRPVALPSVVVKCLERTVGSLTFTMADRKARRGVSDAILTLLDALLQHVDSCVPVLFMDCSRTFNTVWPHLVKGLLDLKVKASIVLCIKSFLKDPPSGEILGNEQILKRWNFSGECAFPIPFCV